MLPKCSICNSTWNQCNEGQFVFFFGQQTVLVQVLEGRQLWYKRLSQKINQICRQFADDSLVQGPYWWGYSARRAAIIGQILCCILVMFMPNPHFILSWIPILYFCWLCPHYTRTSLDLITYHLSTPDSYIFSVGKTSKTTEKLHFFLYEIITFVSHFLWPLIPRRNGETGWCLCLGDFRPKHPGLINS